jgi:hypothetical protein
VYGTPMVPTGRLVVVTLGGADRVSMVPPKLEPLPTAMQLTELAQDTPTREPTPAGAASVLQPDPPSVVVKMVVPATAVHVDELMQLREASVDAAGVPRSFHVVPPSEVLITSDPTATHDVALEHETPSRLTTEGRTVGGCQVAPPFVVLRMAAPGPTEDEPTAVQFDAPTQEIAVKSVTVSGNVSGVHVLPPSVVTMMLGAVEPKSLTAWQVDALTQDTAVKMPTPDGTVSGVHVRPASVVPMTTGLPKMPKPTAVQSDVVGHEIPLRPLTSAGTVWALHA